LVPYFVEAWAEAVEDEADAMGQWNELVHGFEEDPEDTWVDGEWSSINDYE